MDRHLAQLYCKNWEAIPDVVFRRIRGYHGRLTALASFERYNGHPARKVHIVRAILEHGFLKQLHPR